MTPKQKAVIERARKVRARIAYIDPPEPVRRHTAGDNCLKRIRREHYSQPLQAEFERLVRTWGL